MYEEIEKAIEEIQQPRSRFQLEKFVLGQHSTPEMKYYQICLELQDAIYKYKLAIISNKKTNIQIERLRSTGDELDELEAQEKELGLNETRITMLGAQRELGHLIEIWDSFQHKFTRQEIESAQPKYWEQRLSNNAKAMLMGGAGVNPAHIEAMEQAGVLDSFVELVKETKAELE